MSYDIRTLPLAALERDIRKGTWAMMEAAGLESLSRLRETLRLAWVATREGATDEQKAALVAHLEAQPKRADSDDADFVERMVDCIVPEVA